MWRGRYSKSRLRRFRFRQRGFVLPLVMGMGLLMLLVAVTMTFRSQTQNTTAAAQKASERSIATSETGFTRVQDFFSRNRGLAVENFPWTGSERPLDQRGCGDSNAIYAEAGSFNGNTNVDQGNFRIVSYTRPSSLPGKGTLVVEGNALLGDISSSTTRLEIEMGVSRNVVPSQATDPPPMVWAREIQSDNVSRISGSTIYPVVRFGCAGTTLSNLVSSGSKSEENPSKFFARPPVSPIQMPSTSIPLPTPSGAGAISDSSGTPHFFRTVENNTLLLPRMTTLFSDAVAGNTSLSVSSVSGFRPGMQVQVRVGTSNDTYTVASDIASPPGIRSTTLSANANTGATSITVSSTTGFSIGMRLQIGSASHVHTITGISGSTINITPGIQSGQNQTSGAPVYERTLNLTSPLSSSYPTITLVSDVPDLNSEYTYSANSITLSGTVGSKVVIRPGQKVNLFINTSVNGGSSTSSPKIAHNCYDRSTIPDGIPDVTSPPSPPVTGCSPTNFKLVVTSQTTTNNVILSGNQTVDAFIFAPSLTVSLANSAKIRGAVWADIVQIPSGAEILAPSSSLTLNWTDIQKTYPPVNPPGSFLPVSISSPETWVRKNVGG